MANKRLLISVLTVLSMLVLGWHQPAKAGLPPGNALKDPAAILRNALPIKQKALRDLQHNLEGTNDALRGSRWTVLTQNVSSSQFLLSTRKKEILEQIPNEEKEKGEFLIKSISQELVSLENQIDEKNKSGFIESRRQTLDLIGDLEALLLEATFPYSIPEEFDNLPRLLGRAKVEISTSKGKMNAIIDGFNAPLTSGAFIDLTLKGFYDGLPITRAEDFYILQTGDPEGSDIGYIDPSTNEERHVPLEIRVPNQEETIYNQTFEDVGLYKEIPVLPFATLGTLGWAHSDEEIDDGSSQFFFFLYEAELTPAGLNLIDGRNAAFGYVIDNFKTLENLEVNDKILSIKVIDGKENLKEHA